MDRRTFIKWVVAGGAMVALPYVPGCGGRVKPASVADTNPSRAVVVWYSQTGHTARIGRLIASEWKKAGLDVESADYRDFDPSRLADFGLIAIGTPVFYMNVPQNLMHWLEGVGSMDGRAVASFVTFGGHGDGQAFTARRLLTTMAGRGGAPIGSGMFGNMSTFAPTWSLGNQARTLAYRHLPDQETFERAGAFAASILDAVRAGRTVSPDSGFSFDAIGGLLPQVAITKLAISGHHIDLETCIRCGECVRKCPVNAITIGAGRVDQDLCVACFGCINNCPTQAMKMKFTGRDVRGFNKFLEENGIQIVEPV